jgi:hypothetical protein
MSDLESMSTKELRELVEHSKKHHAEAQQSNITGLLKSLGNSQLNYTKGVLKGGGQTLGDIGASALNWPISGIEKLTGMQLPHVPHPNLRNENPESLSESLGQMVGGEAAPFAIPGLAGVKSAQLANRAYQGLKGGAELPLIGRLLAGAGGGALEGGAANEGNRMQGAELGALLGGIGQGGNELLGVAKSIGSKNIAEHVKDYLEGKKAHFGHEFTHNLRTGEEAGANRHMKPQLANLSMLRKAGESKNIYGLEKYNQHPTLSNAHEAQSDLGKIIRKYANAQTGTLERDAYNMALRTRNRLLERISSAFHKVDLPHEAERYGNLRGEFAQSLGPYLNSPTVSKLTRANPAIRANKFADKLLQEENFIARAGENHPGLLRREKYNAVKNSPITGAAVKGAGALAAGVPLTYAIANALGLR